MGQMNGDVVLRNGLDADPVRPLHLEPVHADILEVIVFEIVGISADDAGLVDVEATVAPVETEERHDVEQIDVPVDHILHPGRFLHPLDRAWILLVTPDELEELGARVAVLRHAHDEGMIGPRAVNVRDNMRGLIALDLLEAQRRHGFPELGDGTPCRADIGLKRNLFCNPQQLTILLENLEKIAKILYSNHHLFSFLNVQASRSISTRARAPRSDSAAGRSCPK